MTFESLSLLVPGPQAATAQLLTCTLILKENNHQREQNMDILSTLERKKPVSFSAVANLIMSPSFFFERVGLAFL
jgi:hypothetical protein